MQPTEGFLRLKQSYGKPLTMTGYAKYLPASEKFAVRFNELPTDEFHDCSSTGAIDKLNSAGDLIEMVPDESGMAWYETVSTEISLFGEDGVLGKSIVIYADDTPLEVAESGNDG